MVDVANLPAKDRLVLAELLGVARRYGTGSERDAPRDVAAARVRQVSADPGLLGIAAGVAMADPHGVEGPTLELLTAAGADLAVAEQHAEHVRTRLR